MLTPAERERFRAKTLGELTEANERARITAEGMKLDRRKLPGRPTLEKPPNLRTKQSIQYQENLAKAQDLTERGFTRLQIAELLGVSYYTAKGYVVALRREGRLPAWDTHAPRS